MRLAPVTREQWVVMGGIVLVLFVLCLPFLQTIKWVGGTDLEIEFVVADAETAQPIPGATIHIRAEEGGFCKERDKQEFTLKTDAEGRVRRLCEDCMCFGTSGPFTDTFAVHLPYWQFQVSAAGYTDSDWIDIDTFRGLARRGQHGIDPARLLVSTELQKALPR
jgi:hypothetical protein